jgi:hypothetical protein
MDIVENISPKHSPVEEFKEPIPQAEAETEETPAAVEEEEVKDSTPLPKITDIVPIPQAEEVDVAKVEEPKPEKPAINMPYLLTKMIEGMNLKQSMMKDLTCEEHKQIAMFYSD